MSLKMHEFWVENLCLPYKNKGMTCKVSKAPFTVQGYKYSTRKSLINEVFVAKQYHTNWIVSVAELMRFKLFLIDITQAYVQSAES